ncbi:MAG: type II secretion system protein [Bdellovibrionales bacterium]
MRRLPVSGFTLIEMAVVLVVIGLLIITVFPALKAVRVSGQRGATQSNLHTLMRATAAYVQANGCVPCPTPANTTGTGFGIVRGDATVTPPACGACTATPEGVPPFASLGLPAAAAHDGWGNWITMRVDPALAVLPANPPGCTTTCPVFVPPTLPCTSQDVTNNYCTSAQLNTAAKGLCKSALSKTNSVSIFTPGGTTQKAAVIFISHGVNGYGSYFASAMADAANNMNGCRKSFPGATGAAGFCPPQPTCPAAGPSSCNNSAANSCYAQCNAAGNNKLVDAPPGGNYDNLLIFADRNALVSMLNSASCQTAW